MNNRDSRDRRPPACGGLDPRYLTGPRWLKTYRNPNDRRLLVRKQSDQLGWTVNLAHPLMRFIFVAFVFNLVLALSVLIGHLLR